MKTVPLFSFVRDTFYHYWFSGIRHEYELPIIKNDKYFIYTPTTMISLVDKNNKGKELREQVGVKGTDLVKYPNYKLMRTGEITMID